MYPSNLEDYELKVMANQLKSGVDIHAQTAKRYGLTRQQGKELNYLWMYGLGGRHEV
jgi:hypothetical protein